MGKKIAIIGTGANGSCVASDLIQAGYDTTLIDQWPEHIAAMRTQGLKINMPKKEVELEVDAYDLCDVCTLNHIFDYIFIMVKWKKYL